MIIQQVLRLFGRGWWLVVCLCTSPYVIKASSGALAAILCNPVELAKTRLQAEAAGALVVRPQFGYTGIADCFRRMYHEEVSLHLLIMKAGYSWNVEGHNRKHV